MSGLPPNQCYICYQNYNNERIPLILTTCGHTYCKECLLLIINRETKEIICPECKQITMIIDNDIVNLPKNRSLLNLIIYNEQIIFNDKIIKKKEKDDKKNSAFPQEKNEDKIYLENFFNKYNEVLNKLEDTYNSIIIEHSYLNEISEVLIIKEIDDVLDNFIDVVNEHRNNLRKKIKLEFEKVNLIKNFCDSISSLRMRLNNYIKFYKRNNFENSFQNSEKEISQKYNNEIKNTICLIKENSENCSENNLVNENDFNLTENKNLEITMEINNENKNNPNLIFSNKENNFEKNYFEKGENKFDFISYNFNKEDLKNLENEIKYSELYYLTLKHFSKEIYNPCKFFYVNKFQIEKLCEDLKKMLFRACDFDENIVKYKIEELNNFDEKKILKEIHDSCQQSNSSKLKFLFSHFRINPNFIYSDVLDQITNLQGGAEHSSSLGLQINNNLHNINNLSNPIPQNHNSFSSLNIFDPISVRRNLNNANRNISSRYNSNILSNSNAKDKVFNLFSYLKNFKEKTELNELLRYLIEELNFLPLKIENEGNFDLKLIREFDWKIELGVI